MKKLLTFLMMSVLAIGVGWAETVTYSLGSSSPSAWSPGNSTGANSCTTSDGFTIYFSSSNATNSSYIAWNSNNTTMTVSHDSFYISSIVATCSNGTPGNVSVADGGDGSISSTSTSFTWTASSSSVSSVSLKYASGKQLRISQLVITYTSGSSSAVAAPTFSLAAGTYTGTQNVVISSTTEGAIIYYTLDGNVPDTQTSESIANEGSVTISESCTLKAIAVASGVSSSVSSAIYTILHPCTIPFTETWAETEGTGGNDGTWNGSIASGTVMADKSGWTYVKESGADKCVKLGTTSVKGSATTPPLAATDGTKYTLTFKAGAWSGDATQLNLSAAGANLYSDEACSTELSSVTLADAAFSDYTVYLKATSATMTITWQGLQDSKARFFLDEVNIVEAGTTPPPTVATPVISLDPEEGPYYGGSSVTATITCATEGATISYSTDGTNWSDYTQALTITETTTIQAKAVLNNVESSVASKTVTFVEAPTTVANIAGFIALDEGKEFTFSGDVVVTYVNSPNTNYVWIKDGSGSTLIYGLGLTPVPAQGDIIKGGWSGKKTVYEGLNEITNVTGATIDGNQAVIPAELTLADVTTEKQATYGWLRGVTITARDGRNFTISDGTNTANGYNTYNTDQTINVPEANDGKTYDILGIVNVHGDAQFTPVQFVAEAEPEYYLVGSYNTYIDDNNETQWVQQDENYKFTLTNDGKYILNGVECPDNVEFKILKVKGSQATWCGGPADGNVYGIHGGWYKDIPLTIGGGKNYKIDAAGTFNFTLTIDDNYGNKFTVIKSPVVIRGSFDGWTADGVGMTADEAGWTTTQQLEEYAEFGFRDGWGNWHGGNGKLIASTDLNTPLSMGDGGNFKMEETGNYTLTVNSDLTTLVATKILTPHNIVVESGIEGGTIAIKDNKTTAVVGETVTILVTPNENYVLGNLAVTNSTTQQPVEVTEGYTFVMPDADVLVSGEFVEILEAMFNFDRDYATLFPTITGTSSGSGDTYVSDGDINVPVTATVEGVTLTVSPNPEGTPNRIWNASPRLRMYGGTITISAPNGYMLTGIDISQGKWPSGTAEPNSVSTGTLTSTKWIGSTQTLIIYIGSNTQFKSMNVTYCEIPDDQVMEPVIEGETPFLETTTVTITCSTVGAEIHYTLNGQDPTAESALYTEPFTINEAVTVKAIAFKNGNSSSIASKAFEQIPIVATIADYLALDDNTTFVFTGNAVVTYHNGSNTWIKDETGFALIFASDQPDYSNGDVIPARWGGKKTTYNNVPEITNPTGLEGAIETSEAIPVVKAVADITNDDVNAYYQIKDIALSANSNNFNIVDGEEELVGYNKFNITMPEDVEDKSFNVVGVITIYNNKPEFYIISCEEILQPVVLEGVAFTADRKWATWYGEEALALPENVTAYVVTGINTAGTAVEVESVNYIPANVGVLLYSNTAMESVSAMPAEAGESVTSLLQGGLATISDAYVLYNNQFVLVQDGTTVGAHRCYLPMTSEAQGAPRLLIGDPGTVTGIEDLRYDSNGKPVGYYDLTGRYIGTSLNGKRGIFITSDGKKVVR